MSSDAWRPDHRPKRGHRALQPWSNAPPATRSSSPCPWTGKQTRSGALTRRIQGLPDRAMRTLTWDQGREMARHQRYLDAIAYELNNYPRAILGYHTPTEAFNELITTTH